MKEFIFRRLAILARAVIHKYKPVIIGITGSVGKTSARDAIFSVVRAKYTARKPDKNYNNELGLPLTILGSASPYRNPLAWLALFIKGYSLLWFRQSYPQVLVLEMGVDHPGDMDYLMTIARPHISVLTNIGMAHREFFKSEQAVAEEKRKIIQYLDDGDYAILNADSKLVMEQRGATEAQVITYSTGAEADVKVSGVEEQLIIPARSRVAFSGKIPLTVDVSAVGRPHISACAAAVAVAQALGIEADLIKKGLRDYRPSSGRLNLISGIKGTVIIDDSYNASPDSMKEALAVLDRMPNEKKVAALGDMLELGKITDQAHLEIGRLAGKMKLEMLVTVGINARLIAEGAHEAGMGRDKIHTFTTSEDAREFVLQNLIPGSAILVKGSQGVRMERISKEILAEPMGAHHVLPRQYGPWVE